MKSNTSKLSNQTRGRAMNGIGNALGKKVVTYGKYSSTQSGNPIGYTKGETIQDYRDLANSMSMGSRSNYPVGLSPCFTAGINGDWEEDGFCPISKINRDECTCDDEFKAPMEAELCQKSRKSSGTK